MGLDSVELVMAFEETFGVAISDAEAVMCETPADVIALVVGKIQTSGTEGCLSQRGFYVLRRALTKTLGIDRSAVSLDTGIRSLCSGRSDPELWELLKLATKARRWPPLVRPRRLVWCLWLLTGAVLQIIPGDGPGIRLDRCLARRMRGDAIDPPVRKSNSSGLLPGSRSGAFCDHLV